MFFIPLNTFADLSPLYTFSPHHLTMKNSMKTETQINKYTAGCLSFANQVEFCFNLSNLNSPLFSNLKKTSPLSNSEPHDRKELWVVKTVCFQKIDI